jgi:hypothetical protein
MVSTILKLLVAMTLAMVAACGGSQQLVMPEKYVPKYDYTGAKQGQGADKLSIALVRPAFSATYFRTYRVDDVEKDFVQALDRALVNYFTSNGFTVSGPFDSLDAMTFPEKKQADLVLLTEIDYRWQLPPVAQSNEKTASTWWDGAIDHCYTCTGSLKLGGSVKFTLWEPLSGQRMWSKDVVAGDQSESVNLPKTCSNSLSDATAVMKRAFLNAQLKVQEIAFVAAVKQAERYFHPDEVRLVKQQAAELRAKKVY